MIDCHVVLFLLLHKPVDISRRPRKNKFGMVREIYNRQHNIKRIGWWIIPLTWHEFEQNSTTLVQILTFITGDLMLTEIRGLKLVIG